MDVGKDNRKGENVKLEVESNNDGRDRLSELPDALLIKILSGLPIFQAILTSSLSRRWKSLWMYLLKLDFGFDNSDEFIEGVLTQHKGGKIESLSIYKAYTNEEDSKIGSLIRFAVAHHVEKLMLYLSYDDRSNVGSVIFYKLPECLFLCESLVDLNVWACNFSPPSLIRLTGLKSCALLRSEVSESAILYFTSCCPVIEKLNLDNCNSYGDLNIVLRNPTLLKLGVFDALARERETKINAPYVTSLVITSKNKQRNRFLLKNLSSITKATLNVEGAVTCGNHDHFSVAKIINSLGHVKHLQLDGDCIKVLSLFELMGGKGPSIKSSHLEITTELVSLDIPGIAHVFRECSHVENLKIRLVTKGMYFMSCNMWLKSGMELVQKSVFGSDSETEDMPKSLFDPLEEEVWASMESVSSTIPQGLKTVEICGFFNASVLPKKLFEDEEAKQRVLEFIWREIKLVGILLAKSVNLDRLVIRVHYGGRISEDSPMGRKLLSFPRASEKIVFC